MWVGNNAKVLQVLKSHTSDVTTCDFAPNFTLVTGSSDKTIRIWDWIPGSGYVQRQNSPLRAHKYQVTCVRISSQGSMLASASVDGTAVLWNLHSCLKLSTMTQVNGDAIRTCRFSPDSSILVTAGDNGAICVWDLVHRSLIRTLFEHEGTTQSLAFTPDSQYLISACSLEVIKVWYVEHLVDTTLESCQSTARIDNAHDMGVFCVEISKLIEIDDCDPLIKYYKVATCGNSNEIKIWKMTSKSLMKTKNSTTNEVCLVLVDNYDGHNSSVTCIRYSDNGNYLVSSSVDKLIKIWSNDGNCIATLEGHHRYVNCVAFSKDMSLIASGSTGSNDKLLLVWDLNGNLSEESELFENNYIQYILNNNHTIPEVQLMQNAEIESNVQLLEKLDDISESGINGCCFYGNNLLAIGSGDKLVRLFMKNEKNAFDELEYSPLDGHSYAVNHVEFSKDGNMLASCSLDGCTIIWNPQCGERIISIPKNSLSIKVCRFSPDSQLLITAGDDEKATIFRVDTMEEIASLTGHMDTVTSACFSPDGMLIATTCTNADYRLWLTENYRFIFIKEDAHEWGIQSCDFSQNLNPIPNGAPGRNHYLLATCGNDSLVKLWRISINNENTEEELEVKLWRSMQGHGGNVICVKFSPLIGEFVCSTATDRQARIWSVYSSECLFVLDHDSIVTTCSFNYDCSLLAVGCLDKTLWIWKMPQQLIFQTLVANKIKCRNKPIVDWKLSDVKSWLAENDLSEILENVTNAKLTGEKLLTFSEEQICSALDLTEEQSEKLTKEIKWLKRNEINLQRLENINIPHEFLCPITHEIMREPVTCSDGFTYERNAIAEWFMSGKYSSPMTNENLKTTDYSINLVLRDAIRTFLEEADISES